MLGWTYIDRFHFIFMNSEHSPFTLTEGEDTLSRTLLMWDQGKWARLPKGHRFSGFKYVSLFFCCSYWGGNNEERYLITAYVTWSDIKMQSSCTKRLAGLPSSSLQQPSFTLLWEEESHNFRNQLLGIISSTSCFNPPNLEISSQFMSFMSKTGYWTTQRTDVHSNGDCRLEKTALCLFTSSGVTSTLLWNWAKGQKVCVFFFFFY